MPFRLRSSSRNPLFVWSVSLWSASSFPLARTSPALPPRRSSVDSSFRLSSAPRLHSTNTPNGNEGPDSKMIKGNDDNDNNDSQIPNITPPLFEEDKDNDDEFCEVIDQFGSLAMERFCEPGDNDNNNPNNKGGQFRWIRLEKSIEATVQRMKTKQDVLEQIRRATEAQAKYGNALLYPRRWKDMNGDLLLDGSECDDQSETSFTVMQFNALAEGLSAGPDAPRPFILEPDNAYGQSEKNSFGGFTNVKDPQVALDFALRRWRLLEVLVGGDGTSPFDVIAMEEVDRFYGFLAPLLRLFGYEGIFVPKTRSPSVRMGWYSDGCCLFWKSHIFELISEKRIEYKVGSQVLLLAVLKHRPTGQFILTSVTHLKAQRSEVNEKIRCAQVNELVERLKDELALVADAWEMPSVPVLVMGDFNADVPTQTTGDCSAIQTLLSSNISPNNDASCTLQSVYQIDPADENFYTTWKTRGTSTTRRIIDYIFYGGGGGDNALSCQAYLAVPEPGELDEAKLPGLRYPSDHMAIAAKFDLGRR